MLNRELMRLYRPFEEGSISGYVLGVGAEFFLLADVSDQIWLNGFECLRLVDIEQLEPAPHARFVEAALQSRGEILPDAPAIALDNVGEVLASVARRFPLVTIHPEITKPDVCYIGQIISIEGGVAWMLDIDPDAVWETEPTARRLDEITRISFGCDYEAALALVGGAPPATLEPSSVPLRLVADNG